MRRTASPLVEPTNKTVQSAFRRCVERGQNRHRSSGNAIGGNPNRRTPKHFRILFWANEERTSRTVGQHRTIPKQVPTGVLLPSCAPASVLDRPPTIDGGSTSHPHIKMHK